MAAEEVHARAHLALPQGSTEGAPGVDFERYTSNASTTRQASGEVSCASSYVGRIERRDSLGSMESIVSLPKHLASRVMVSPWFDACIGVVIFGNAIAIGAEQSLDLSGADISAFTIMEHIFLTIYVLELIVRVIATSGECFGDNWVRFDLLFVGIGVLSFWIIFPIVGDVQEVESLYMLRLLRLLRLARSVRLIALFRDLWMLVQGLLVSARTMVYTIGLIAVILYLFAIVAIEVITKNALADPESGDPVFRSVVEQNFNGLPQAMLTLMQFVSFDNVVIVYEPLIKRDWRLAIFFISIIVIVGILLMNLVTAVVVNSALEQAMADKEIQKKHEEKEKRKMCKELRKLFVRLDEDASGQVTMDEIGGIAEEDKQMLASMLGVSDPLELFRALDVDGSGEVDIEEFCNGIWQVCISKAPIEIKRIEKMVESMRHQLRVSERAMADMVKEVGDLKDQLEKSRLRSSSAPVATPGAPESGGLGSADGTPPVKSAGLSPRGSSASWDQAPLRGDVQSDCDGQLVSIIGACVREAVGAALREHRVGGAIPVAVYHAGQGCPQKPSEGPPFGPDIAAAPGWVEELKLELQSLRAAGPRAALGGQAHGGPKAQAQGTTAADLVRPLPRASLAPSKDAKARTSNAYPCTPTGGTGGGYGCVWSSRAPRSNGSLHRGPKIRARIHRQSSSLRPPQFVRACVVRPREARDGSPSPARRAAGSSSNSGACQPKTSTPKAPPQRARPGDGAEPAGKGAAGSRGVAPSKRRSPARAPETLPEGSSAREAPIPQEAAVAERLAAVAGARAATSPTGCAGPLAQGMPAGPAEIHHL